MFSSIKALFYRAVVIKLHFSSVQFAVLIFAEFW